ncbi:MAG: GntR family transcriptional regulator, partial [Deinococcota bacterium]|nr:GntR family transcriptional regulator [Deinococcota bacterium]
MMLNIDKQSPLAIGEQITGQLRVLIICGVLEPGQALPTVKELAAQVSVNANTVAAAYGALERVGWLTQRKKAGTRVAEKPPLDHTAALMSSLAGRLATQAERLGLDSSALLRTVAAQLALEAEAPGYQVAVLAGDPLQAAALAERAGAL